MGYTLLTRATLGGLGADEDMLDGIGIKIFPPVCGAPVGVGSCLPPSDKVNTTTDFPSEPSKFITLGIGSPGLRFKTIDVCLLAAIVVTGCFIAICLGKCDTGGLGTADTVFVATDTLLKVIDGGDLLVTAVVDIKGGIAWRGSTLLTLFTKLTRCDIFP